MEEQERDAAERESDVAEEGAPEAAGRATAEDVVQDADEKQKEIERQE